MAYLVLSYPVIKDADFELIQHYRKDNDELFYSVVDPHFTIVFPVFDFPEELFINEVTERTKGIKKVDFNLRCATINKDAFKDYYHTFLVPDEGYSKIIKLHDKLYSGKFKNDLRLDLDFIPHIGIGNSKDKFRCKQMVDEWNGKEFSIEGVISSLSIIK